MNSLRLFTETELDLTKIKPHIDAYSVATGISSFVINEAGKTIYYSQGNKCHKFCSAIQKKLQSLCNCPKVHLYGSYQAERFGGKYIFFCPMGLTHWVSPLTFDGFMQGAILGGPVLMLKPEDFLLDEIIEKNVLNPENAKKIKEYINRIPIVKPEIVTSLSHMLMMVSHYITGDKATPDSTSVSHYLNRRPSFKNYPIDKENQLLSCVSIGDKVGAQKVLNEILGYIFFSGEDNFNVTRYRMLELVVLLSRAALEGGAQQEEIFGLNNRYINQIYQLTTLDDLTLWLSKILLRFTDCVFNFKNVKNKDIIYKTIEYTNAKYMEKISLEEIATHVNLSPSYFSKLFKTETGINYSTYLNQVRVEKSKELLLNEDLTLVEISNLVGFEEQSYFTKVFRRITGTTPGKFRETRGRIKI